MSELPRPELPASEGVTALGGEAAVPPAAPAIRPHYAGFWIRLLALMIDGIIVSFLQVPLVLFTVGTTASGAALQGFSWLISFFYFGVLQGFLQGTLGKKALGLKLVRADLSRVDVPQTVVRYLMSVVSGLALGLGYLWVAFDSQKRSWHDRVAGTRVIRVG